MIADTMVTPDVVTAAAALVESRREQGLPPKVTDPSALALIAAAVTGGMPKAVTEEVRSG